MITPLCDSSRSDQRWCHTLTAQYKVSWAPVHVTAVDDSPVSVDPLRQQWILIQQIQSCTSCWLAVTMIPPPPEPLLQSGPAGASWGWSRRWCELFSSGIRRMSPWVWGCPVASQPWTQSHLFLQCPGRERRGKACMLVSPRPQIVFVISLKFVRPLANGSIYAPFVPWEGRGDWKRPHCSHISLIHRGAPNLSGWHRNTQLCLSWDWEGEQLVSKSHWLCSNFYYKDII